jgi:hypothetical protein
MFLFNICIFQENFIPLHPVFLNAAIPFFGLYTGKNIDYNLVNCQFLVAAGSDRAKKNHVEKNKMYQTHAEIAVGG